MEEPEIQDMIHCNTCGTAITEEQHNSQEGNCSNCELWWELNDSDDEYYEEDDDE